MIYSITIRISFLVIFLVPASVKGQSEFSFLYEEVSFEKVIQDLEKKMDVIFSYTDNQIDSISVTASGVNKTKVQVLDIIFSKTRMDYHIVDEKYIVITRTPAKELNLCVGPTQPHAATRHMRRQFYFMSSVDKHRWQEATCSSAPSDALLDCDACRTRES